MQKMNQNRRHGCREMVLFFQRNAEGRNASLNWEKYYFDALLRVNWILSAGLKTLE